MNNCGRFHLWFKLRTRIHMWRWYCRLSTNNSSNIRSSRWVERLMSIDLYLEIKLSLKYDFKFLVALEKHTWMYSSKFRWLCGLRNQTNDPTTAPSTKKKYQNYDCEKRWNCNQQTTCCKLPEPNRYENRPPRDLFNRNGQVITRNLYARNSLSTYQYCPIQPQSKKHGKDKQRGKDNKFWCIEVLKQASKIDIASSSHCCRCDSLWFKMTILTDQDLIRDAFCWPRNQQRSYWSLTRPIAMESSRVPFINNFIFFKLQSLCMKNKISWSLLLSYTDFSKKIRQSQKNKFLRWLKKWKGRGCLS